MKIYNFEQAIYSEELKQKSDALNIVIDIGTIISVAGGDSGGIDTLPDSKTGLQLYHNWHNFAVYRLDKQMNVVGTLFKAQFNPQLTVEIWESGAWRGQLEALKKRIFKEKHYVKEEGSNRTELVGQGVGGTEESFT